MEATFCLYVHRPDGRMCISEDNLANEPDRHLEALLADGTGYGEVKLRALGQPTIAIDDEVWAIVMNLCFDGVVALADNRPARVLYMRYSGSVTATPVDAAARVSGDLIDTAVFELKELLPALYDCGQRFVEYLRRLAERDSNYQSMVDALELHAEQARRALGLHYLDARDN